MKRWTLSAAAVLAVLAGLEPFAPARGSAGPDRAVVELALVNPVPGLVAAYGFEAGSGEIVFDSSGSGNNGTIRSATWTTAGRFGGALDFNGTDSWVVIPDAASLDLTTGMTLEAWVAPDVLPSETCTRTNCSWMDVVHKDSDRYHIEATSNVGRRPEVGGIFTSGKHILFGPEPLPTHAWTHLALTFEGRRCASTSMPSSWLPSPSPLR